MHCALLPDSSSKNTGISYIIYVQCLPSSVLEQNSGKCMVMQFEQIIWSHIVTVWTCYHTVCMHMKASPTQNIFWYTMHFYFVPPEEKVWGVQVPTVWPDMVQRKQLGGDGPRMHDMPHHGSSTHSKATAEARWSRKRTASPQRSLWNVQETGIQLQE